MTHPNPAYQLGTVHAFETLFEKEAGGFATLGNTLKRFVSRGGQKATNKSQLNSLVSNKPASSLEGLISNKPTPHMSLVDPDELINYAPQTFGSRTPAGIPVNNQTRLPSKAPSPAAQAGSAEAAADVGIPVNNRTKVPSKAPSPPAAQPGGVMSNWVWPALAGAGATAGTIGGLGYMQQRQRDQRWF